MTKVATEPQVSHKYLCQYSCIFFVSSLIWCPFRATIHTLYELEMFSQTVLHFPRDISPFHRYGEVYVLFDTQEYENHCVPVYRAQEVGFPQKCTISRLTRNRIMDRVSWLSFVPTFFLLVCLFCFCCGWEVRRPKRFVPYPVQLIQTNWLNKTIKL